MDMMSDRFARLERENGDLNERLQQLEGRNPTIYLIPQQRYMVFNDGYILLWYFFDHVEGEEYDFRSGIYEPRMYQRGEDQSVALDEAHWNAFLHPTGFIARISNQVDTYVCDVEGRTPHGPVVFRDFHRAIVMFLKECHRAFTHFHCPNTNACRIFRGLVPALPDAGLDDEKSYFDSEGLQLVFGDPDDTEGYDRRD